MLKERIFVYGQHAVIPAAAVATAELAKKHTIVAAGLQKYSSMAQYICVNDPGQLDELMLKKLENVNVLAPRNLYAKYVFHAGIECLPNFQELQPYQWDPHAVSQQLLCVALAAWLGAEEIYLFGYAINDDKELENIQAMAVLYPNVEFLLAYKDKPNTNIKKIPNLVLLDQPQYKERMRQNG